MLNILVYGLIYVGIGLMVCNIYCFAKYIRKLQRQSDMGDRRLVLYLPIALLVMFLLGYLAVAVFGEPDLIIAGILSGGSVFVYVVYLLLERITSRISETEHLKAELMAAEQSSRAKSQFLSSMSHEMRTPMNAIIGLDDMALRNPDLPPETRQLLVKISLSAHHLLELINDVLDMSRIESGHIELKQEPFPIHDLLEQVNAPIQTQCAEMGLRYTCTILAPLEDYYLGDAVKLRQVLINILGNAVKFTPAPGDVSMTVEPVESREDQRILRFAIRDTGTGMDPEFIPHIFEMFAQEDGSGTTRYGGSGLGMAIVKGIVEAMGGDIAVESAKGRGSTFTVTVALRASEGPAAAPEAPAEPGSLRGRRVLIAEDMDINAEILTDLLDMEGVESEWAEDGSVAVERFAASPPGHFDAVLMDMRMPVMDGLDAARAIRALKRADAATVPIVAVSANAFEDDVRSALESGMNAHLGKPIEPDRLYETLRKLLCEA